MAYIGPLKAISDKYEDVGKDQKGRGQRAPP